MAQMRFPVQSIESYMPSVEARMSPDTRILAGKNFTWDSRGPKSGFGALQLTPFPLERPRDVQSIRVEGRSLTFTQDAILSWRDQNPQDWELLHMFATEIHPSTRYPWQAIFLSGYLYLAHPLRGFFEAEAFTGVSKLWLVPRIPGVSPGIPGLPTGIKGMLNVRGMAILVNDTHITWSSVGNLNDLTPTLGGAGFQRIDGIVAGSYLSLTSYQNGFIVWTTKGAIIAEYIGGNEVWRFDPLISTERPLNAWSVVELSSGASAMLTTHGMFTAPNSPQAWTPDFNEFFREYVQQQPQKGFFFRVEYDFDTETVYVLESEGGPTFNRAFVLKPTLNKWGIFNVDSYGMGQLNNDDFGYVRHDGIPYIFRDVFFREETPLPEAGLDRHKPRIQKQMIIPSSTAVSRALTWPNSAPEEIQNVSSPDWYAKEHFTPSAPYQQGMDSFIHVGYLRNNAMNMAADAYAEFNEISIHTVNMQPTVPVDFTTQWYEAFFYPDGEDWNYTGTLVPEDVAEDWMSLDGEDDWLSAQGQEDWLYESSYTLTVDPTPVDEDWNVEGTDEDFGGNAADFPLINFQISIHASQDGITVDDYVPTLAKFSVGTKEFATMTSGSLHYLRFEASEPREWYAIYGIDLTMGYGGQQG